MGVPEDPIRPISVALGAEATFAARALDNDIKHLEFVIDRAAQHVGTAFVEVYQNCVIFNDGCYDKISGKDTKAENTVYLEHGKPLIFGTKRDKGIRLNGLTPEVVNIADVGENALLKHDEFLKEPSLAFLLSRMRFPEMPEPFGVFRDVRTSCYNETVHSQIASAITTSGAGNIQKLLTGSQTWNVQ